MREHRPEAGRGSAGVKPVLLALAALVLLPALVTGQWYDSHDRIRYAVLAEHFKDSFLAGHLYPRWLPELFGGYGYPTFCFYQPGFFYAWLLLSWLPGPYWPMYTTLWLLLALGGLGAYRLALEVSGDRLTALFGWAVFLITPYLYLNLYVRGDLSELMSMLVCPWAIWLILRLGRAIEEGRPPAAALLGLALSLALIVYSHPATALFFFPVAAAFAGWCGVRRGWGARFYALAAAAFATGVVLSSPYWLTVYQLRGDVNLDYMQRDYNAAERHVVAWWQLFSRTWEFGGLDPGGTNDEMSFQLGLFHFLVAVAGAALSWRVPAVQAAFVLYLALVVLMTPVSYGFWLSVKLARYVQFPWRLLSITATLQLVLAAGLARMSALPASRRPAARGALCAALLAAGLAWHAPQFSISRPLDLVAELQRNELESRTRMRDFANVDEFRPKTTRDPRYLLPRGITRPVVETDEAVAIYPRERHGLYRIHVLVTAGARAIIVNQLYFPGWRVFLDGRELPDAQVRGAVQADGRIRLAITPGPHEVEAFYDGPPGRRLRTVTVLLLTALFAALCVWEHRRARCVAPATGSTA